jgi:hypothetical protein
MNQAGITFGSPFGRTCTLSVLNPTTQIYATYLSTQKASNALAAINPPETITKTHPPQRIRTSTRWTRLDSEEATETPALRRIARLWVELGNLVDKFRVCWRGAGACEVRSTNQVRHPATEIGKVIGRTDPEFDSPT